MTTNLWVSTVNGGYVRADAITEIAAKEVMLRNGADAFRVVARLACPKGSWDEDSGHLDPVERSLAQYDTAEDARTVAERVLRGLIIHAGTPGILTVAEGGMPVVESLAETPTGQPDSPK